MIWTVGAVPGNMEMKCVEELKQKGIEAFVPLVKRWTKPSRKRKPVMTTERLFPGYIFLRLPSGGDFKFLNMKNYKLMLLHTYDKEGNPKISELREEAVAEILQRSELGDLFDNYDKKALRRSLDKNQLVCWRDGTNYALGFVAKNTQGRPEAYVKVSQGKQLKISVALLSLL